MVWEINSHKNEKKAPPACQAPPAQQPGSQSQTTSGGDPAKITDW